MYFRSSELVIVRVIRIIRIIFLNLLNHDTRIIVIIRTERIKTFITLLFLDSRNNQQKIKRALLITSHNGLLYWLNTFKTRRVYESSKFINATNCLAVTNFKET